MKKLKQFLRCNAKAGLWLIYFIVVQAVVSVGIFFWLIYHDDEFADRFVMLFTPIVEMKNYVEQQMASYEAMEKLLMGLTVDILMVASTILVVTILCALKIRKRTIIHKIDLNQVLIILVIGTGLNLILSAIVSIAPEKLLESHKSATNLALSGNFFVTLLATGILGPMTEELIFRYGVMKSLEQFHVKYAIIYQALIFGLLHGNIIQIAYAFILGLLFGYLYWKTDNLLVTMLLHITINTSSVIITYLGCGELTGLLGLEIFLILVASLVFGMQRQQRKVKN